jgi:hypothetical protein
VSALTQTDQQRFVPPLAQRIHLRKCMDGRRISDPTSEAIKNNSKGFGALD